MKVSLQRANYHAKKSCPKWNKSSLSRRLHRYLCHRIVNSYCRSADHKKRVESYRSGSHLLDTYVWPYSDPDFAGWSDQPDADEESLVRDPSGCVIRRSTSYCAYKIRELVGKWPQQQSSAKYETKDWLHFLAEAGYTEQTPRNLLTNGHHYVGINPDRGESGLVVWLENISWDAITVEYSTYYNQKYRHELGNARSFIWVEIA